MGRRTASFLAATALTVLGCGHGLAPSRSAQTSSPNGDASTFVGAIIVDPALIGAVPEVVGAWLLYGATLTSDNAGGAEGYAAETRARTLLADTWKEKRRALHDAYLDLLVDVRSAGFISEYVIAFLARPGWIIPGGDLAKLNLTGFKRWIPSHLPKQHRAETRVDVHSTGTPPLVPGAGLPPLADIDPGRVSCAALQPAVASALRRWDQEEAHLDHVALSVQISEQLLPTFERAMRDERARRDGVAIVSPKAGETLFVAGFCALEGGALAPAERLLRRAVTLSPARTEMRVELAQTLILEKKLDDADAQLDAALEIAVSPCHLGMLWRKRGYILFDRGKLAEAYNAYARSLEYDPGSEIARTEMQLIVSEIRRIGGVDEKALKGYAPPTPGPMSVTTCQ